MPYHRIIRITRSQEDNNIGFDLLLVAVVVVVFEMCMSVIVGGFSNV